MTDLACSTVKFLNEVQNAEDALGFLACIALYKKHLDSHGITDMMKQIKNED
jgi:hypothetical protein